MNLGHLGFFNDFLLGGVESAILEVVEDVLMEEDWLLRHNSHRSAQTRQVDVTNVLVLNQDFPTRRIVEAI